MAFGRNHGFGSFSHQEQSEGESVNLVPIMNLFVVLIPFLLMSAAFFNISVINASVPALQTEKTDLAKSEEAVTLMIQLLPSGYRIVASSDTLSPASLAPLRTEIPRQSDKMDLDAFGRHLYTCKQQYPKSDTVILVPASTIPYEDVIQTMDAARWLEESGEKAGTKVRYELFPNVVISGML